MAYKDELQDCVDGFRRLADWLEGNGEKLEPYLGDFRVDIFCHSAEEFVTKAKLFGSSDKVSEGSFVVLRKRFGKFVGVELNARHEVVCKRVLVHTKVIPAHTIPASPEMFVPERVEEKYEWRCPDSILKGVK